MSEIRYGALSIVQGNAIGLPASGEYGDLVIPAKKRKGMTRGDHVVVTLENGAVTNVELGEPPREMLAVSESPHPAESEKGTFFNPYTFVPLGDRDVDEDGDPPAHDEYAQGRYSGVLDISITAESPLLVLDQAGAVWQNDRATMGTLTSPAGEPYIPGSAIKGMLRSAFEIVTGSRMGVFDGSENIFVRDNVDHARDKRPAVVVEGDKGLELHVVTSIERTGIPSVMVPRRLLGKARDRQEVRVEAVLVQHEWPPFKVWRAVKVMSADGTRDLGKDSGDRGLGIDDSFTPVNPAASATFRGFLQVTGKTAVNKHDERLVVTAVIGGEPAVTIKSIPLTERMVTAWRKTIASYLELRSPRGIELPDGVRSGPYGKNPRPTAPSPADWRDRIPADWELKPGRTLFVELDPKTHSVRMLSPAMVGRRLMPWTPRERVAESHLPAQSLAQLSPADRVFGWVKEKADDRDSGVAYRGNVQIEPALRSAGPLGEAPQWHPTVLNPPLTLGILSSPKPQQVRFYFGPTKSQPLADDVAKSDLGSTVASIRGAKVYPPHLDFDLAQVTSPRQPDDSNQSRSIADCIPQGAYFRTTMRFMNLTRLELGALLYLVTLPQAYHHRLGMGKPLGFGSVHVSLDRDTSRIWDHEQRRHGYRTLSDANDVALPTAEAVADVVSDFLAATQSDESSRRTWERLSAGYAGAVHYPRTQPPGPPEDGYTWFVTNEHDTKERLGRRVALPKPGGTLPYNPSKPKPPRDNQRGGRPGGGPRGRR
ncbi:MAG: hypothetical protein QG597_4017 [Actinomycetota bacterium]|nr:hypothetical protein [Actinomycetota bacterium]